MNYISDVLFWISTGMLVPVIILLMPGSCNWVSLSSPLLDPPCRYIISDALSPIPGIEALR